MEKLDAVLSEVYRIVITLAVAFAIRTLRNLVRAVREHFAMVREMAREIHEVASARSGRRHESTRPKEGGMREEDKQ